MRTMSGFYSHVNYSVTKIIRAVRPLAQKFYSHVNYSVTKMLPRLNIVILKFYSHVNYSVTKMDFADCLAFSSFTVT